MRPLLGNILKELRDLSRAVQDTLSRAAGSVVDWFVDCLFRADQAVERTTNAIWKFLERQSRVIYNTVTWPYRIVARGVSSILQIIKVIRHVWPLVQEIDVSALERVNIAPLLDKLPTIVSALDGIDVETILDAMKSMTPDDLAALPDLIALGKQFRGVEIPAPVAASAPTVDPELTRKLSEVQAQLRVVGAALADVATLLRTLQEKE